MPELSNAFSTIDEGRRRSTIERVVTSYRHPWDIFAELIQNCVDAINAEAEQHPPGEFIGQLHIEIDSHARQITIRDNGEGISPAQVGTLIATSISLKRDVANRYGFMGFGLTFVAFQTLYLKIDSVKNGQRSIRTYVDLFRYVFGQPLSPLPEAAEDNTAPETVAAANGTTIVARFPLEFPMEHKEYDLAQAFSVATNEKLFAVALRSKTAIGNVDKLFGRQPATEVNVTVTVDGKGYAVPYQFYDYSEMLASLGYVEGQWTSLQEFNKLVEATANATPELQQQKRQETAIFYKAPDQLVGERTPLSFDMYIFATSKSHFLDFNKLLGPPLPNPADEDEESPWGLSSGVHLAFSGMPSSIKLDNWTHPSLYPFTVLINAHGIAGELDAGRKGISTNRGRQIMASVMAALAELGFRRYAKYVVGGAPPPNPFANEREAFERSYMASEKTLTLASAVHLPPREEQEVIALFFDLLGRGTLKGYQLKALSAYRTYDGLMSFDIASSPATIYDRERNPLGILSRIFDQAGGRLQIANALVEFKLTLAELYADLRKVGHSKDTSDLNLLVCWSADPRAGLAYGDVVSEIRPSQRYCFGSTHSIITAVRRTPLEVMSLSDVIRLSGAGAAAPP
jgi:hypothetical protein